MIYHHPTRPFPLLYLSLDTRPPSSALAVSAAVRSLRDKMERAHDLHILPLEMG